MKRAPQYAPDQNLTAAVLPHDAYWSIEPSAGRRLWQMLQSESFGAHMAAIAAASPREEGRGKREEEQKPYEMRGSTAILYLTGPMTKNPTSFSAGTSTVRLRRLVRQAASDSDVKTIVIRMDSPGGSVSGTADLASDVAMAAAKKPVLAYVEDYCCSACYWIASQCSAIYANATALVGSIGTLMVIDDSSRAYENAGIEVLVFGSGKYKGAGTDGAELTAEHRAYFQATVDSLNSHFLAAVKGGRSLSDEQLEALTDARVHVGQSAVDMGLVDRICSLDDAFAGLSEVRTKSPLAGATTRKGATGQSATEERRPMRNPFAAWNIFKAGMAAAGADVSEEGEPDNSAQPAFAQPLFAAPAAQAKPFDINQSAEYQALKAQNELLSSQIAEQSKQIGALTGLMTTQAAAAQHSKDCERIESLVRQMKMTPAEAVGWKTLARENPEAFAASFATQESRPVISAIRGDVTKLKMANTGDPGARLASMAQARAKADKISVAEAAQLIIAENPDLARAHVAAAPVVSTGEGN